MQNQKLFLTIAIFLTIFLLWDKWQITHTTDENGNLIKKTQLVLDTPATNSDVPMINTETQALDVSTPSIVENHGFTTVTTDLLTVEISHQGGTIQNAYLNEFPTKLGGNDKFQLLNNQAGLIFQAQSGLASRDNMLPNHLSKFVSEKNDYQLSGDTLVVPLTWKNDQGIAVTKNFRFKKGSYLIDVDYQISNNTNQTIPAKSYVRLSRNALGQGNIMMPTFTGGIIYDKQAHTVQKNAFDEWNEFDKQQDIGGWMAMVQQYFLAAWIPDQNTTQVFSSNNNNLYKLTNANQQINIASGESALIGSNQLYLGPKEYGKIEDIATGLHYTLDYGWLDILADPLSWGMHKIYEFVHSWGLSIIILTILIKLAFYPLSEKSYRSMAGMRKLSPRLTKLKEKYGDDRQKMGQKTMELYKKEKINPASGCLPILVQIPVFIAFYWMLLDTVELRHTAFLWMPDLTEMDPYFILPIIMGASMFIQQKLNPPPPDPMQAKIMMSLPFVFTILFIWFPAGLVLYWVFNNILSIAQQWSINKRVGS